MHVFFEEDGGFKVGTILADNTTSFQIETLHGKRAKIKAGNVLLQFKEPALNGFLEAAQALADGVDLNFLWEVSGTEEFEHQTLGRDYFGHAPNAIETAGLLLRLHNAPMYFYKKGKGRYKAAPPDALKAALASEERKRQQAALLARYVEELRNFHLPLEFPAHLPALLYAPEKNALETKALEQAASACGLSPLHLLAKCGAIPSTHDFHFTRFLRAWFPAGPGFSDGISCAAPTDLPLADVAAFSIDDETTTEIDDAFSLKPLDNGDYLVGIHIAAPALGIARDTPLEAIARQRLSTVYMPGQKITMLPESAVEAFTLKQGSACPALSLYLTIAPDFSVRAMESRVERVTIAANLRHEQLEPLFNADTVSAGGQGGDYVYRAELEWLWQFANHLEVLRGVKDNGRGLIPEYGFKVIEDRVQITHRMRGTPIDKVVAEMMILANSRWGDLLAENNVAAIYRAQTSGKTRMTTEPLGHQGLGVAHYTWSSSPLRRYIDLVNQRQLIAWVRGETPPYAAKTEELEGAVFAFEQAYEAYNDFQRQMEKYWVLRYFQQEGISEVTGSVIRENLVRLEHVPLVVKAIALPETAPGTRVKLTLRDIDLLTLELSCPFAGLA